MELEWRDLDYDSADPEDIRRDLAEGKIGPRLKSFPCMMHQTAIDLDIRLDGPLLLRIGGSEEMTVVARLVAICDGHR